VVKYPHNYETINFIRARVVFPINLLW